MENICVRFFKGGHINEEEEEIIVDYLSENDIDVNINTTVKKMCYLALKHKLGGKEKAKKFIASLNKEEEIASERLIANKYGDLDIRTYLKIALDADDATLLNMMKTSKVHANKFNDVFFLDYLTKNYPNMLKYRLINQYSSYKNYYLSIIYSISKLKEDYNFIYSPQSTYDVIKLLKEAEGIRKNAPQYLETYLNKFKLL